MSDTRIKTMAEEGLEALFAANEPDSLAAMRGAAFAPLAARGLPSRRVEAWKYSDLRAAMGEAKPLAGAPDTAALDRARALIAALPAFAARKLVLVNGVLAPELSDLADLEPGLSIRPLRAALDAGDAAVLARLSRPQAEDAALGLNTAFLADGLLIDIAAGAAIDRPLLLVHAYGEADARAVHARVLLTLGAGAAVTVIECATGPAGTAYQANMVVDLAMADGARLDHLLLADDGGDALVLSSLLASVGAETTLNSFTLTTGGAFTRRRVALDLTGADAHAALRGASLLAGRQHADTTLVIDHIAPSCESREQFKHVLADHARGVFQGAISVKAEAQHTDARMLCRGLLLSDTAEMDAKPELEIFADDVQCAHGATTGALDQDLLFYLMSRGITQGEAEALLIQAFIGEVVEQLADESWREVIMEATRRWQGARKGRAA